MVKKFFQKFGEGENITVFGTILLVLIALIGRTLGWIADPVIDSLLLALLGLIAIEFLRLRHHILDIINSNKAPETASFVELLDDFPSSLSENLNKSNEIWMLGISLRKSTFSHFDSFSLRIKNDLKIRAMLINPYSRYIDLELLAKSYSRKDTPAIFAKEYDNILERYKLLHNDALEKSNVKVGLLDFVPPFSLYIFPQNSDGGIIYVQIYAYKAPVSTTPYFVITQKRNPLWYNHFITLYEKMWEDAADYFSDADY
jgi:hypothetical protein